jgi:putative ABC transport system permease protein
VQKFEGMVASQKVALSMFPMGPTLKNEFPEIKNFARIWWTNKFQLTYDEKRLYLPQVLFADSTFLDLFEFKLVRGDRKTALQQPKSAVITESTADKLFGKENPIGKTVTHYGGDTSNFIVTGVLKDVPQNSQIQFDALFSFNTIIEPGWMNMWGGNWLNTYLELADNTNVAAL